MFCPVTPFAFSFWRREAKQKGDHSKDHSQHGIKMKQTRFFTSNPFLPLALTHHSWTHTSKTPGNGHEAYLSLVLRFREQWWTEHLFSGTTLHLSRSFFQQLFCRHSFPTTLFPGRGSGRFIQAPGKRTSSSAKPWAQLAEQQKKQAHGRLCGRQSSQFMLLSYLD